MSGGARGDPVERLLKTLDRAWTGLRESYAGLSDAELQEPGVVGDWSVKDVLAHVTTWDQEALKYLPLIAAGGWPPRYSTTEGGIDAFNERMSAEKRGLSLAEVREQLERTHAQLVALVRAAPMEQLSGETRWRRRLRLDTYAHYAGHAEAIRTWREALPGAT
jgi:hypothetical protein